ncbi:MAG: uncharacterized protein KVP18_000091 [Porospora cf. gigantea A]|uniref:uncharacterized protein n=2 Tax=Porospora cf. gigantea A TaxID=2853593 RepID=UPI0035599B2E|nr:MAG: hypothetical protein KVP18_000091 [Porospora cf. gigantea A]
MEDEQDGAFSSRWAFWLTIAGCSVGFGNVWRFPYVVYTGGGLSFLIIYLLVLAICAIPTLIVEFGIGQVSRHGIAGAFSSTGKPGLRWAGVGAVIPGYMSVFYPLLIVWSITYFVACFQKDLPWQVPAGDVDRCAAFSDAAACVANNCFVHNETELCVPDYIGAANGFFTSALHIFPNEQGTPSSFYWGTWGYLLLTYLTAYAGVCMGPSLMGKIMYVTMTLPTVLLIVLLIVGATLKDASIGITRYIVQIDPATFGDLSAYVTATTQAVFSCSLGTGILFTLGGHNPLRQNFVTDAFVMTLADTAFAFVAGFVVFAVMGHLAGATGVEFSDLPLSGSGLAFKSYPVGLTSLPFPWANILTALFFMVLALLGWDTLVAFVESLTDTILMSNFNKRKCGLGRKTVCGGVCICLLLVNSLLATDQGAHWLDTVDHYVSLLVLLVLTWLENMLVSWVVNDYMCLDVVGPTVYYSAWFATAGVPAIGGVVIGAAFNTDTANGGGYMLLATAVVSILGICVVPLVAKKDRRDGSDLAIKDRYYYVYGANVMFFRDQVKLLTQRPFWSGWMYIMKVPCTMFLTCITAMSFGTRTTWVFSFTNTAGDLAAYSTWLLTCALILVLSSYLFCVVAFFKPALMDWWVSEDIDRDLLTRDAGFGYLDPERVLCKPESSQMESSSEVYSSFSSSSS